MNNDEIGTLADVAQALKDIRKQLDELRGELSHASKSMKELKDEIRELGNRHLKLLDELNDAYHELAEGETFLGEITPDDARDAS